MKKPQIWNKNMVRMLIWLDPVHNHQRTYLPLAMNSRHRRRVNNFENHKELLLKEKDIISQPPPRGFLAVYVGPDLSRFLIPANYLSMPDFMGLMERAEEEFGFQQEGGLRIPCEEDDFQEILSRCRAKSKTKRKGNGQGRYWATITIPI